MKKILFVEDEARLQKLLTETFISEGFEVISALDGEAGLAQAEEQHPDIILLDLILPKKDGFTVLKELKENPKTKDIPVIVLTNLETVKDIERILSLGATTYLVKVNYDLADIVQKVRDTLEQ